MTSFHRRDSSFVCTRTLPWRSLNYLFVFIVFLRLASYLTAPLCRSRPEHYVLFVGFCVWSKGPPNRFHLKNIISFLSIYDNYNGLKNWLVNVLRTSMSVVWFPWNTLLYGRLLSSLRFRRSARLKMTYLCKKWIIACWTYSWKEGAAVSDIGSENVIRLNGTIKIAKKRCSNKFFVDGKRIFLLFIRKMEISNEFIITNVGNSPFIRVYYFQNVS